jgi:hypothetical protein
MVQAGNAVVGLEIVWSVLKIDGQCLLLSGRSCFNVCSCWFNQKMYEPFIVHDGSFKFHVSFIDFHVGPPNFHNDQSS